MSNKPNRIWIMLRGLTREQRHWEGFPYHLREHLGDNTIVLPDLPGSGIHHREKSPTRIREIVEFVRADIAVHLFDKPVHLLGLSLGGMVALEWARCYPQECAGAVLINTSLRGLNPFYQRLKPGSYLPLFRALLSMRQATNREQLLFDLTSNLNSERDTTVANWVRYASELPTTRLNALRQLLAASRYKLPAEKPQVPLLLLRSMADRLVDPACSARLAKHWDVPLQSHPTAGHDLTLDDSEWVCQQLHDWLHDLQDGEDLPGVV